MPFLRSRLCACSTRWDTIAVSSAANPAFNILRGHFTCHQFLIRIQRCSHCSEPNVAVPPVAGNRCKFLIPPFYQSVNSIAPGWRHHTEIPHRHHISRSPPLLRCLHGTILHTKPASFLALNFRFNLNSSVTLLASCPGLRKIGTVYCYQRPAPPYLPPPSILEVTIFALSSSCSPRSSTPWLKYFSDL